LTSDGNTALIGGAGAAYTRSGATWTQQGQLISVEGDEGGVGLSSDGNTALIGYPYAGEEEDTSEGAPGEVRVFTRSGSTWTQQGEAFTMSETPTGHPTAFGSGGALSSDGNAALIGSY